MRCHQAQSGSIWAPVPDASAACILHDVLRAMRVPLCGRAGRRTHPWSHARRTTHGRSGIDAGGSGHDFAGAVKIAREALDRRDQDLWLVADLAAEVAPAGTPGRHDDRLAEFAERIGSPDRCKRLGDLGDLRRTATVLSKPERIDPSGHVVNVWTARRLNGYERLRIVRAAADCTRRAA
jgi:hypothetical protein